MKQLLGLLALPLLLAPTACGSSDGTAVDPGPAPSSASAPSEDVSGTAPPTAVPAARGEVTTRRPVTVVDSGDGPELCLGAVLQSSPPQCGGPPLRGWDWADRHGDVESSGDVRWGSFVVTGTFDGTAMTVDRALPAAAWDPAGSEVPLPDPTGDPIRCSDLEDSRCAGPGQQRLRHVQHELQELPGILTADVAGSRVVAEVVHDDGSLQAWVDASYGRGTVLVTSALVPVDG